MAQGTKSAAGEPFTDAEKSCIATLVDLIIPASETYGVPSAADAKILDDILTVAAPHADVLGKALSALDALAEEAGGSCFAEMTDDLMVQVTEAFRRSHAGPVGLLVTLTTQCYYRDDRVMRSLDMEPRAPHPEGYTVEQGDWSLLDPVKARAKIYREVP